MPAMEKLIPKPKVADFVEESEGDEEMEDVNEDESDTVDGRNSD